MSIKDLPILAPFEWQIWKKDKKKLFVLSFDK